MSLFTTVTKLNHLRTINSVDWATAARSLWHLYPDYRSGRGVTRSLVNVTLELTYRCNWKCNFCFLKDNVLNRRVDELTLAEIEGIVDEVAPLRLAFYLTGGEPFVRKDTIEIIRAIKRRGLKVGVNTNAHLLDEAKIDELREIGLDYLISSIHGPKEVHERVVGLRSFDRVIAGLRYWNSKPRKTRLLINYVITPETSAHMNAMVEIARDAGVDALTFQQETFLTKRDRLAHDELWQEIFGSPGDVELSYLDFDPAAYDVRELAERIDSARKLSRELGVLTFFKPDLTGGELENWYSDAFHSDSRCSYIYTDARINPRGDVITCQFIPKVVGNIRQRPLLEIVNDEPLVAFRQGIQRAGGLFPACARCCKLHRAF